MWLGCCGELQKLNAKVIGKLVWLSPVSLKLGKSTVFKSQVTLETNLNILGFQVWTENLFLLYFPNPLLAALVENRGGPHEAVSGVGAVAAVGVIRALGDPSFTHA